MKLLLGITPDQMVRRLDTAALNGETAHIRMCCRESAWFSADFILLSVYRDNGLVIIDGDSGESVQIPLVGVSISYKSGIPEAFTVSSYDLEFTIELIDGLST